MPEVHYENVCIEGFAHTLPEEVVTSEQLERRLAPLYERLKLPEGRLELISGVRERRFWPADVRPSQMSIESGRAVLQSTGVDSGDVGVLIHGSVCRDFLEPATACSVHEALGLSRECLVYDVSNACLGMLNGMVQVAAMIELGQIRAGLVVGTESSRRLVETTIERLNTDTSFTRGSVKPAFASLTIGSASAAVLLCHRKLSRAGHRLLGGVYRTNTDGCRLCQSEGLDEYMNTDSERLMRDGIAIAQETFDEFLAATGWSRDELHKTYCHQVGRAHHRLLFESLGLDQSIDFTTYEWLGNTGSAALPISTSLGIEQGHLDRGDHVGLLGIGSGINCLMLAAEW